MRDNTFSPGDGLADPEGLDIGGPRAEHALVVGLGVALSGGGTVPALGVVQEQILGENSQIWQKTLVFMNIFLEKKFNKKDKNSSLLLSKVNISLNPTKNS